MTCYSTGLLCIALIAFYSINCTTLLTCGAFLYSFSVTALMCLLIDGILSELLGRDVAECPDAMNSVIDSSACANEHTAVQTAESC